LSREYISQFFSWYVSSDIFFVDKKDTVRVL